MKKAKYKKLSFEEVKKIFEDNKNHIVGFSQELEREYLDRIGEGQPVGKWVPAAVAMLEDWQGHQFVALIIAQTMLERLNQKADPEPAIGHVVHVSAINGAAETLMGYVNHVTGGALDKKIIVPTGTVH